VNQEQDADKDDEGGTHQVQVPKQGACPLHLGKKVPGRENGDADGDKRGA
jgi:hypothetical protein